MVDPQVVEYLTEEGGEYAGGGTSSMLSPSWLPGGERGTVVAMARRLPRWVT